MNFEGADVMPVFVEEGCGRIREGWTITCRKNSGGRVETDRHLYQSLELDKDANRSQSLKTGEHNTPY